MPQVTERSPIAFVSAKMDDGSAELLHAVLAPGMDGPHIRITGDGTLQHPLKAVLSITLREGSQFGAKVYKPGCEISRLFAAIARTETITPVAIMHIKGMGYTVKVEGRPEVTL